MYEPFDFSAAWKRADQLEICPGVSAPMVPLDTLLEMKREAGRPQDLADIKELHRAR